MSNPNPRRRQRVAFRGMDRLEPRQLLASIAGTVWEDLNTSRTLDGNEGGLAGWTVFVDANRNRVLDSGEARAVTDANGRYRLDNVPDGTNHLAVVLREGYGQTYPSFDGSFSSDFNIELNFLGDVSPDIRRVFMSAAAKWQSVLVGDLPDAEDERGFVDDISIDVTLRDIDGPDGLLGQAAPTSLRPGSSLPIRGTMEFDLADSDPTSETFYETVLHEMAHALGYLLEVWEPLGLVSGVPDGPEYATNPRFIGPSATAEYNRIFNLNETSVPLEPGTRFDGSGISHWRESVFGDELMSPFAGYVSEPLSRITAAAFADMGYQVNLDNADVYAPGSRPQGRIDSRPLRKRLVMQTKSTMGQLAARQGGAGDAFTHTVLTSGLDRGDVNFGVRRNSRPQIGQVLVSPNPQVIGSNLTIRAWSITDADNDPMHAVVFYRESNGIAGLQTTGPNADAYIGTKTSSRRGTWSITAPTSTLSLGDVTYYARAIDDLGAVSTVPAATTIVATQAIPAKPTPLSATVLSSSRVLLEWTDRSDDESGFVVQRSTDPSFRSGVVSFRVGPNVTSLLLTDQPAATQFFYRVRAFNTAGNSAFSGQASAFTFSAGESIVDNRQASFRGNSWFPSDVSSDLFYGRDFAVSQARGRSDRATFTPAIDYAGEYFIYARWIASGENSTSVPIDVITPAGTRTFTVDQTRRGGGWVLLGKFNLPVGDGTSVRINAGKAGKGNVIADAVRFLPSFVPTVPQAAWAARQGGPVPTGSGLFASGRLLEDVLR